MKTAKTKIVKAKTIKDARKDRDKSGFSTNDDIWVAKIVEDTSNGKIKINKRTLYAGPMIEKSEVDFWKERITKFGESYVLAVIELNECDDPIVAERGQAFFVNSL